MLRLAACCFALIASAAVSQAAPLELKPGDRISIIGNLLAERMQHDGWLETLIQSRFPEHKLSFRNLGFSGDEVAERKRSEGFGSPDEWLTRTQADVVFAFFGFGESFAGEAGLEEFQRELDAFVKHTVGQKYNGEAAARLVLFSPIAFENLDSPDLPDGRAHNRRLELYTQAMAEIAEANDVPFVDLFRATRALYDRTEQPLTINGAHLTSHGNRAIAEIIDGALFGTRPEQTDAQSLEKLRQAVADKNFYWFHRYRTTDGYNVYGGRSHLKYTQGRRGGGYDEGLSNRVVMQREMEVLDAMAANRDERVWAAAHGRDLQVDDSRTPEFIPVQTNYPGPNPDGSHVFLGGEEALSKMTPGKDLRVNLFASEEMFPELISPVQMSFDPQGRLWVATWPTYPHWKPKEPMDDRLLILEDTDGDGQADKCTTFAGGLHCPTGFEFYNGGVIVAMAPHLLFLKDTDGDDRADVREPILHGFDSADTHHTANSFALGPDGGLYFQEGVFHQSQIETIYGVERNENAAVWRFEPRTGKVDRYVPYNFANPHGHVFGRWGADFVVDGTGANPYDAALISGYLPSPQKHPQSPQLYQQRTRPCSAIEILSSRHFPEEQQGNLLVLNVIGFLGVLQYRMDEKGGSFAGTEVEPILSSTDPNFRPTDLEIAPDGSLYVSDWQNPIIGHMQHHIRDPNRDKVHGRVYRVTHTKRPLLEPPQVAGATIPKLLDLLEEPEDRLRYRVRIELSGRPTAEVIEGVEAWVAGLDESDPDYEHHLFEALSVHQVHNVVNVPLLERVLSSPDHRARAAATRALCYWRDRVPEALARLRTLAADEHPRVRLEAVRAASFFTVPEAVEVPLIAMEQPGDEYLDYVRGETMKALDPHWRRALADGRQIELTSEAGMRYLLRNVSTEQLLEMPRSQAVFVEMLYRPGLDDERRREALRGLAELAGQSELQVLLDGIRNMDARDADQSVVFDLVRLLTGRSPRELAGIRGELEQMATGAQRPVVRQVGYVALISADRNVDRAWELASESVSRLHDLVSAMPLIPDPSVRAGLAPKVEPLLNGLPAHLETGDSDRKGTFGRYVRIELPRRGTLTLAEVEVLSDGRNVAPRGQASQKNTAHGGDANRAIDGVTSGLYGRGGQTHTQENTENPWWELDLQDEVPVEAIVVHNRHEGDLGRRLDGFTLQVLDGARHQVFVQRDIPAPDRRTSFQLGGSGPEGLIRRAAMTALTYVRGRENETFRALAGFVKKGPDRIAAIRAMQRIPRTYWPADEAPALVESLIAYVQSVPEQERRSPAVLESLQLGDALASLLPADQAQQVRSQLGELGVRVVRLGTLPHRMAYDKDRLVVRAGKPVEIIFENIDLMPHNLVILRPGSLVEIGTLSDTMAQQPEFAARDYVPQSDKVLLASRLLQPRDAQTLSWTAPSEPGVYPFVCTYPGHWRRMHGALYVVEDLDAWQADPEAYLASAALPVHDEMLEHIRPRTEWKLEDLAPDLEHLAHGRSFGSGKQMFQVANCVACHKLNGTGNAFGPDLAELDPKFQPADILKELIDPSARINEKFQTQVFVTEAGKTVSGLVIEETPEALKVIENPLAATEPIVLKRSDIVEQQKSETSIMPKGLLDKLSREEILDLIAYVYSRGSERHKLYAEGGGHAHDHGGHSGHDHSGHR